jgi:hypothetical protein
MQGITYSVDLVLVIDATGSMRDIIEKVKERALGFHSDLEKQMNEMDKNIDELRIRVVLYRDFYFDSITDSLQASPFFTLPAESAQFSDYISGARASGGGDEPETALEALAEAMRSPWSQGATKRRQLIAVWTDASAHPLEKNAGSKPVGYPANAPADFDAITDMWEGGGLMDGNAKRLILFSPDAYPWTDIASAWESTINFTSRAGEGLREIEYNAILEAIAHSV